MTTPTPKQRLIEAVKKTCYIDENDWNHEILYSVGNNHGVDECLKLIEEILPNE